MLERAEQIKVKYKLPVKYKLMHIFSLLRRYSLRSYPRYLFLTAETCKYVKYKIERLQKQGSHYVYRLKKQFKYEECWDSNLDKFSGAVEFKQNYPELSGRTLEKAIVTIKFDYYKKPAIIRFFMKLFNTRTYQMIKIIKYATRISTVKSFAENTIYIIKKIEKETKKTDVNESQGDKNAALPITGTKSNIDVVEHPIENSKANPEKEEKEEKKEIDIPFNFEYFLKKAESFLDMYKNNNKENSNESGEAMQKSNSSKKRTKAILSEY